MARPISAAKHLGNTTPKKRSSGGDVNTVSSLTDPGFESLTSYTDSNVLTTELTGRCVGDIMTLTGFAAFLSKIKFCLFIYFAFVSVTNSPDAGMIAGIVIAVLVIVAVIGVGLFFYCRKVRQTDKGPYSSHRATLLTQSTSK